MSLASHVSADGEKLTIVIDGKFDSSLKSEFRSMLYQNSVSEYIVDLQNAEYVDSSALGMLLVLREHANASSSTVRIINSNQRLQRVLTMAKFDLLFSIQK